MAPWLSWDSRPESGCSSATAASSTAPEVPRAAADVRIEGDAIVEVGPSLTPRGGERVIDAAGRIVAPGFIDMHSHADGGLDQSPDAATQLRQGITTALVGQDGGSEMPVADLTERVERVRPAINLATSVGHGTVRRLVMGEDFKRAATAAEIETMKALVERGMKDGAVGLSSGLEYDPGFYATTDELTALATAIKPYGGIYSSHVRDEENEYLAAWKEAIDVGRRAGVAVEISHMKLASKPVWGRAKEGLALLDAARREGLTVMGDWYPYPYWQSAMYVLIPDRDFENVEKWRVGLDEIGGAGNVRITNYRADPSWNGKTLAELAAAENIDAPSLIVRMVKADGPAIGIIGTSMDEADMKAILAHPQVLICSDGQLSGRHPRGYGAFPRVLARYVREQQVIALEEAIAKMTSRSAAMLGLVGSRRHRRGEESRRRDLRRGDDRRSRHAAGTRAGARGRGHRDRQRAGRSRSRRGDQRAARASAPAYGGQAPLRTCKERLDDFTNP